MPSTRAPAQACGDVIVIGAGIVGAACAYELAGHGLDVCVLDNRDGGATHAGMGHLVLMDDNAAQRELCETSLGLWRRLARDMPANCAYRRCGTLWVAGNEAELELAIGRQAALQARGIQCALLSARELARQEPMLRPGLAGALKVVDDAIVYAPSAAAWMLKRAEPRIRLRHATVSTVEANRITLEDGRTLTARAVVVANGIQAAQLVPALPIRAKKGHLVITDRYPACLSHQLVELGYAASAHQHDGTSVAFNVQPRPTGQLLIGSSRQFDSLDAAVDASVVARMLQRAAAYLPALAGMNAIRCWTGFRAATPDGLPVIGAHPEQPGLWLAAGHEGLGVTTAPGSAHLLAALLLGHRPPIDPAPYAFSRFASVADTVRSSGHGDIA
ncbi:FAD-dependent oxidoreductase [Cupriavidus basilensis]|uniref:FAD-dependent oxidoreductase n=1 Tax=Cupriavidus basilensis TaxID=68895 RepID=A0ABT6B075_9BURK|nr:FAD-dependent oxidoreductase [Cupriavidus basilensis]MDF3838270.1 FAD-dependent oxidoreductase [Cupriavidus basilensis]